MTALNTVVNAMLTRSRAKLIMASAISGTVSAYFMAKRRVIVEDGGPEITNPLITSLNPNVTSTQYYDTVPIAQTDEFDTVTYNMTRVVGSLIISDQEQDENQGAAAIFKILKGKIQALDEAISRKFANYYTSTATGNDPNGLPNLLPADPTTGTIGGISLASESQWRPSSYDFNGTLDTENIEEAFDDILELDLTRGKTTADKANEKPSVIFAGRNIYRMHKGAARDKQQISLGESGTGKKLVNLGIVGTTHNGVPLLYDETLTADDFYIVNDKYMSLHILRGVNMRMKRLASPWNMDAIGRRLVWEGQLCSWRNYRTHAYGTNS